MKTDQLRNCLILYCKSIDTLLSAISCSKFLVYSPQARGANFRHLSHFSWGTKGDPVLLLAGCLWVMEIPGGHSKNAALSYFQPSIQAGLHQFLSKFLGHIFSRFGPWEDKMTLS